MSDSGANDKGMPEPLDAEPVAIRRDVQPNRDQREFMAIPCERCRLIIWLFPPSLSEFNAGIRKGLETLIAGVRGDIHHIETEMARLAGEPLPPPLKALIRRRPKAIKTLQGELECLLAQAAWLHSQLIEQRGERVFSDPAFERLAAEGLMAGPTKPEKTTRGGQSKRVTVAAERDFWVRLIQSVRAHHGGEISNRDALRLASRIVWEKRGSYYKGRETGAWAENESLKAVETEYYRVQRERCIFRRK